MANEEEKGEGRVLDLDNISGEGKTLKDIIESGEEIPDELIESIQSLAQATDLLLADFYESLKQSLRVLDQSFKGMRIEIPEGLTEAKRLAAQTMERIAELPIEISSADLVGPLQERHEGIDALKQVFGEYNRAWLEAERTREEREQRKERERRQSQRVRIIIAIVGWFIAIIAIAVQVITWWLGR